MHEAAHAGAAGQAVGGEGASQSTRARKALRSLADARSIALLLAVAVAYSAVARLSLLFVLEPQNIAGIWPPAGIALGVLLRVDTRRWPHVVAGIAVAVATANLMADVPARMTAGFTVANALESLLAATLLRRVGFRDLATIRGVWQFFLLGAVVAPAASASIGATTAVVGSGAPFVSTWLSWLLGDAGGIMAIAPLVLLVGSRSLRLPISAARTAEALALGVAVVGITSLAFLPLHLPIQLQAYPVFLLLVVAAVRFGIAGAAFFTFAVSAIAVGGTIAGGGPIVLLNAGDALHIGQAQILVAVAFLASTLTAAVMAERQRSMDVDAADAHRSQRLTAFAREISQSLEADALFQHIVQAASRVVDADVIQLTVAMSDPSRHTIVAALGAPNVIGRVIESGDGITGAVIRDGEPVVRESAAMTERATVMRDVLPERTVAIACVPVVADGEVTATLGVARFDLTRPFSGDEVRALGTMGDLTSLALRNAHEFGRVHDQSIRDGLTGVPNRRYFDLAFDQLAAQRARQPAESRLPVSAVLFDLDHFGAVNKERGHETGDRVLATFGEILATSLRRADIVARYGGEEFIAVLVGTDLEGAMRAAEKVRVAFADTTVPGTDGEPIRATVSAGVACAQAELESLEHLIGTADVALSMAKRGGRNQVTAAAVV